MALTSDHPPPFPRVIGHRGACGLLPEHTLASYQLAIDSGADAIELDLISTRDHQLIACHDLELSATTDVADIPHFEGRRTERSVDGQLIAGWFAEDFTLAEIKTLRARQRLSFRAHSHDGRYEVPSLAEVLDLVVKEKATGRDVAVYLELKHAAHHAAAGVPLDRPLLAALRSRGLETAQSGVCIEAFEPGILRSLRELLGARFVQLIESAEFTPRDRLAEIRTYADGIGVWKRLILPTVGAAADESDESGLKLAMPTSLISDAHAAGLSLEAWTFRDEPRFLAADYAGDPLAEYRQFFALGVDGVISDFPKTACAARLGSVG
jgi:glycerophosphoryl diester phosphodiesterase